MHPSVLFFSNERGNSEILLKHVDLADTNMLLHAHKTGNTFIYPRQRPTSADRVRQSFMMTMTMMIQTFVRRALSTWIGSWILAHSFGIFWPC